MHKTFKSALLVATAALAALGAQPAMAQKAPAGAPAAAGGIVVPGLAVADLDAIVANSAAARSAATMQQTTYKAQYDQAKARDAQLTAQIKPLADKFNADRAAPNANQDALEKQYADLQAKQQAARQELQQILQPVSLSQVYVQEQIEDKLGAAVSAAMTKKKISILLKPDTIVMATNPAYNLNQDILTELNTLIPSAQIVPPQDWQPRQVREARAQQQQAAGGAAAPTAPATTGR